jgi:hypothetical protein
VLHLQNPARQQADPLERCEGAFGLVRTALDGAPLPQADAGVAALQRSLALLQSDQIERVALGARVVHFRVPTHVATPDLARCLAVPRFDADLAAPVLLLPQARAKRDGQHLQLISVQAGEGWFHDLLYPGYCWAETPDRWRPPGLVLGDGNYRLDHAPLHQAAVDLNGAERGSGRWVVAESMSVFGGLAGRGFPVALSLLHEGGPAPSTLPPQDVAHKLAAVWESAT